MTVTPMKWRAKNDSTGTDHRVRIIVSIFNVHVSSIASTRAYALITFYFLQHGIGLQFGIKGM
jgi:hypothetical protein